MSDPTEDVRRAMVGHMPAEAAVAKADGEQVWTTDEMREEFEVLGFAAPFVVVKRRSDGVKGSLKFAHNPRTYFDWAEDK